MRDEDRGATHVDAWGGQVHVGATLGRWATAAGRRRTGGIRGARLWVGMNRGRGNGGRHDSVGVGRQIGGGETGAGWSDYGGGTSQPRDLV
jgi:hypothetical protein